VKNGAGLTLDEGAGTAARNRLRSEVIITVVRVKDRQSAFDVVDQSRRTIKRDAPFARRTEGKPGCAAGKNDVQKRTAGTVAPYNLEERV